MIIREYKPTDCEDLVKLFYHTVHTINAKDYSQEQLKVWATDKIDLEVWNKSLSEHFTVVAVENNIIVGFGDIDNSGYLDRLYVHKDYQRRGVATIICDKLEQAVKVNKIITHASITAKPFFEQRGFKVVKEHQVVRNRIALTNYVMEKQVR
jgi:putative acetyltransferase